LAGGRIAHAARTRPGFELGHGQEKAGSVLWHTMHMTATILQSFSMMTIVSRHHTRVNGACL